MAEGISIRLTAVPVSGPDILVPDVKDVSDLAGYAAPGPLYVPVPGSVELPYTSRVALSLEEGSIQGLVLAGDILVTWELSASFLAAVGGGGPSVEYVADEVPSGVFDGFNVNYTMAFTPAPFIGLYLNGQKALGGGVDYTQSGTSIVMTVAPVFGEDLRVDYIKSGTLAIVADETPSGLINGVNPTFTTAFVPTTFIGCFVNGIKQSPDPDGTLPVAAGYDYVISGSTITFGTGSIPGTGESLKVDYIT